MVSENEMFYTLERIEYLDRVIQGHKAYITEDINVVISFDALVPIVDQSVVHFSYVSVGTVAKAYDVFVPEMHVGDEEWFFHAVFIAALEMNGQQSFEIAMLIGGRQACLFAKNAKLADMNALHNLVKLALNGV